MSLDQNARRSHNIKTDGSFSDMVEEIKHLGTAFTDHNSIQEENNSRVKVTGSFVFQFAI